MSLKQHLKAHNKAYSLGFLAVVAAVVGFLFIQVDNLSMTQELTGALISPRGIRGSLGTTTTGKVLPGFKVNPPAVTTGTLTVAKALGLSTSLNNGENRLMGLEATAGKEAPVTLTKIVFNVTSDPSLTVGQYKLYRGATLIGTADTPSFTINEMIMANSSMTYYVDGVVSGVVMTNSSLKTEILGLATTGTTNLSGLPISHTLIK